jgi:hypothetical protein
MSSNLTFQAAVLRAGKQGIIKPDPDGYYTQCIGGLDIENAAGVTYASEKAKNLFLESSSLMRRIRDRALRGEVGHPRRGPEHANFDAWMHRLNDIFEPNVCVYWSEVSLDENYGRNNPYLNRPNMIGIMARYRPGGAHGHILEKDLADPMANVSFSIRAFSIPRTTMGKQFYDLQSIVTWDYVNEPGIAQAQKLLSATMESRYEEAIAMTAARRVIDNAKRMTQAADPMVAMATMESKAHQNLMQLDRVLTIDTGISKPVSIYVNWANK